MEFMDKALTCIDCGNDFVFTAGEQLFFHDKQFKNEPKRCKFCKAKRAALFGGNAQATTPSITKWKPVPSARHATRRPPYPSARPRAGRSFAESASNRGWRFSPRADRSCTQPCFGYH